MCRLGTYQGKLLVEEIGRREDLVSGLAGWLG